MFVSHSHSFDLRIHSPFPNLHIKCFSFFILYLSDFIVPELISLYPESLSVPHGTPHHHSPNVVFTMRSRTKRTEELNYVMKEILEFEDTDDVMVVLKGNKSTDIEGILATPANTLQSLRYSPTKDPKDTVNVAFGELNILRALQGYVIHLEDNVIDHSDNFKNMDKDDFWRFVRSSDWCLMSTESFNVKRTKSPTTLSTPAPMVTKLTTSFKKGIKRDASLFKSFKDDKYWDTWRRHTLAQARAQDVADVLNESYVPVGTEEADLFEEKQKYMHSMFDTVLLTDKGKAIVREHEDDFDAQTVYKKLKEYCIKSTKASLEASKLLSYVTSVRIDSSSWKGSTEGFILH